MKRSRSRGMLRSKRRRRSRTRIRSMTRTRKRSRCRNLSGVGAGAGQNGQFGNPALKGQCQEDNPLTPHFFRIAKPSWSLIDMQKLFSNLASISQIQ